MGLPSGWAARMRLPIICAPMYQVTTPDLMLAARRAGIIGALPRANAPSFEVFDEWLGTILEEELEGPWTPPVAVNLSTRMPAVDMERHLAACRRRGVELIISATGNPTHLIQRALDHGLRVFSDAISLRFAEKAIESGAHGVVAIGGGGGGHSGRINHLTLVGAIRRGFGGTVVMAGAVDSGAAVRAGEVLGADLAYVGTRFIASTESGASAEYKDMLVKSSIDDLFYTPEINGVHANWLVPSMRRLGLDPDKLPVREPGSRGHGHLPPGVIPWSNLWSAGQSVEMIRNIKPLGEIVDEIEAGYRIACSVPRFGADGSSRH